jgi:hypothetical protein
MHDFNFYRIEIAHIRYIAGFGRMGWIDGTELTHTQLLASNALATQEASIIEHMNTDHVHSLVAYCKHFHQIIATQAQMLGIDRDGFDVKVTDLQHNTQVLRFHFNQPIEDAQSARVALVAMSKAATT